jgi:hypothetical protein
VVQDFLTPGHVTSLGHIILIPIQPVFALSPLFCMLSGEATNTSFIVFGLTHFGSNPQYTVLKASANHYTTDAVPCVECLKVCLIHTVQYVCMVAHEYSRNDAKICLSTSNDAGFFLSLKVLNFVIIKVRNYQLVIKIYKM